MTQSLVVVVAVITVMLLAAMSVRANYRFRTEPRLPMQWWLDGSPTWSAPRPLALAFTPVLAAVCLAAAAGLTIFNEPRPGQEGLVVPVNILGALIFLSVHALHLWLVGMTIQRRREQ